VKTVSLPLWLVTTGGLLAAWALLFRILIPGVRWFFRRREEVFVRKISSRLNLRFPAFKFARKKAIIERLTSAPEVLEGIDEYSREQKIPTATATKEAESYAREIVPTFHAYAYFLLGSLLGKSLARLLYRVRMGFADEESWAKLKPQSSVVFLMNHRSNMDYVLLGYLTLSRAALSFAVGEWARVWPIKPLVKAMGAYFVRRQSGNPLYRRVLASYVRLATEGGLVQAVYPEGKLSRDGNLHEPKVGILDYMLRNFDPGGERDLVFIPAGINYDRVFEDRTLLLEGDPDARKDLKNALFTTLSFIFHNIRLMAGGGWHRFGYAAINFGTPVSMRDYAKAHNLDFRKLPKEARIENIRRLAGHLFEQVGRAVPALPVSLVASVFLKNPEVSLSETEIKTRTLDLMDDLERKGAYVYVPRKDRDYAVQVGLRMLTLRHLVLKEDAGYRASPAEIKILKYYANSISHLVGAK
jgi:glycerol-3-phosphate O-acyltransferase